VDAQETVRTGGWGASALVKSRTTVLLEAGAGRPGNPLHHPLPRPLLQHLPHQRRRSESVHRVRRTPSDSEPSCDRHPCFHRLSLPPLLTAEPTEIFLGTSSHPARLASVTDGLQLTGSRPPQELPSFVSGVNRLSCLRGNTLNGTFSTFERQTSGSGIEGMYRCASARNGTNPSCTSSRGTAPLLGGECMRASGFSALERGRGAARGRRTICTERNRKGLEDGDREKGAKEGVGWSLGWLVTKVVGPGLSFSRKEQGR
jgi:hypothetical protein